MNVSNFRWARLLMLTPVAIAALAAVKTGPDVGATIPAFTLPDQNGREQSLSTIAGPQGAMIVFYRSADW